MANIMNSYFYGKAGQGDYTVDQLPKNRKELFFAALKVRFSSMIGLNLLHVLWFLPLAIWLFIATETAMMYLDDAQAAKLGNEALAQSYTEFATVKEEYDGINGASEQLALLNYQLENVRHNIQDVEAGKQVMVEEAAVVEGGESTMRAVTIEELRAQETQLLASIEKTENYIKLGADETYMSALKTSYAEKYSLFAQYRKQALNGNILLSLLVMIPLLGLVGVGQTGQAYVLRNWARDEHSFMMEDYKGAIKENWKQGLAVGIMNGLSFVITYVAYLTYGSMADSSAFFVVPQMLMIVLLIVWWMMNEIIFTMMVTYEMKLRTLIRNSLLIAVARLPFAFLILLGIVIVPVAILLLVPYTTISLLVLIVLYGIIGFSFTGFVKASFANSCFDKYLNPRIEGAKVNQGLHTDNDEDDEDSLENVKVEEKEDRFWEHKTK